MVIELNELIKVYDDVLDFQICQTLINLFENNNDRQERIENQRTPNFTQFNLTENCQISEEISNIHNYLIQIVFDYKKKYYDIVGNHCFPSNHNFEQFRIKKYKNDGTDVFDIHVDVKNYASARRFLSFFWYLNDVEDGGETVFNNLKIVPKTGRMIIFPPLWMFPHEGKEPISNTKYILSTYLHYR
jgi:prolyl 4-hydroxylase